MRARCANKRSVLIYRHRIHNEEGPKTAASYKSRDVSTVNKTNLTNDIVVPNILNGFRAKHL